MMASCQNLSFAVMMGIPQVIEELCIDNRPAAICMNYTNSDSSKIRGMWAICGPMDTWEGLLYVITKMERESSILTC